MFGNVSSLSARYCIRLTSAAKKPLRMIPDRISPSVLSRPRGRRGRKSAPARRGRRKGRGHHQQTADAQQDRQRAAEGGAGGHPDDVRIHQRVLEHALQGGAAQPQRAPASRAITTRGRRTDQTICPITPSPAADGPVWPTALRLNGYWPKQSEATAIASVASAASCTSRAES